MAKKKQAAAKKVATTKAKHKSLNDENKFLKILEHVKGLSPEMRIKLANLLDEHDKKK